MKQLVNLMYSSKCKILYNQKRTGRRGEGKKNQGEFFPKFANTSNSPMILYGNKKANAIFKSSVRAVPSPHKSSL